MRYVGLILIWLVITGAASTTFLFEPFGAFPTQSLTTQGFGGSDDVMLCYDFVEVQGITNSTHIIVNVSANAGTAASFTIYTAGGASILRTTGVQNWSTTGIKDVSGLSTFSTVQGTEYRACWCRDGTGGSLTAATAGTTSVNSAWANAVSTHMGTAANPCVNGAAPTSTGALTTADLQQILFELNT